MYSALNGPNEMCTFRQSIPDLNVPDFRSPFNNLALSYVCECYWLAPILNFHYLFHDFLSVYARNIYRYTRKLVIFRVEWRGDYFVITWKKIRPKDRGDIGVSIEECAWGTEEISARIAGSLAKIRARNLLSTSLDSSYFITMDYGLDGPGTISKMARYFSSLHHADWPWFPRRVLCSG